MGNPILTEPDPRTPAAQRHPGAWLPGSGAADRGAEYGAPSVNGQVSYGPQRQAAPAGHPGGDETAPSLGDVAGRGPAIGDIRR